MKTKKYNIFKRRRKLTSPIENKRLIENRRAMLMYMAIKNDHVGMMKVMLDRGGMNFDARHCITGMSLLHAAIRCHHYDVALRLISLGADVCATTHEGKTPLQFAVMNNSHVNVEKKITAYQSQYMDWSFYGWECLLFAIEGRSKRSIKNLVSQGVNSGVNHALVKMLLDFGARVNTSDHNGCSPLQCAIYTGDIELVRTLLDAGADISHQNESGGTALHDAVLCCNAEMVHLLLNRGADVDACTVDAVVLNFGIDYYRWNDRVCSDTALHWAAQLNVDNSHKLIIELLLAFGSDINQPNFPYRWNITPLNYILMNGDVDLVKLCIDEYNANLKQRTIESSAELFAVQNKNKDVLDLAIRSGMDFNLQRSELLIKPLHFASLLSRVENVRRLIFWGADVNSKDIIYSTPLYLCIKTAAGQEFFGINQIYVKPRLMDRPNFAEENARTIRLLLESGSDVNVACNLWNEEHSMFERSCHSKVEARNIIIEHVAKVAAKTSKRVFDDRNTAVFMENPEIQSYYQKCQAELTTMRATEIVGTSITYWSLLTEPLDVVARYARNEDFVKEFETVNDYQTAFPTYAAWLRDKFDEAVARLQVLQRVCTVLSTTLQFAGPSHVAFEIIFKYLSEPDTDLLINC